METIDRLKDNLELEKEYLEILREELEETERDIKNGADGKGIRKKRIELIKEIRVKEAYIEHYHARVNQAKEFHNAVEREYFQHSKEAYKMAEKALAEARKNNEVYMRHADVYNKLQRLTDAARAGVSTQEEKNLNYLHIKEQLAQLSA